MPALKAPQHLDFNTSGYKIYQKFLIAEIQAANTIAIGIPAYNFSAPAPFKAQMDLVARPSVTFTYTDKGPKGLLDGKKVIIVAASSGEPFGSNFDFIRPHKTFFFILIGINDSENQCSY